MHARYKRQDTNVSQLKEETERSVLSSFWLRFWRLAENAERNLHHLRAVSINIRAPRPGSYSCICQIHYSHEHLLGQLAIRLDISRASCKSICGCGEVESVNGNVNVSASVCAALSVSVSVCTAFSSAVFGAICSHKT